MEYKPTIGLEIHVELKTKTKMFCRCLNDRDEEHPNMNVCPVCMGHPGTLPVANEEAIKKVLLVGKALKGKLATFSQFDRKNYFYPDLPKGYQISQYKYPLVEGGELNGIKITRVHLEEDTGRLLHDGADSLVDFNRSGVPLMELVTEPDIESGAEVRKFAEELQLILRYLNVSDADMEKGQMRVEVNISVSKDQKRGTKVEIKNLNSIRAAESSVDFEIKRQSELLERGEKIAQETRGWDEGRQVTFSQREKEESHDYRYFPEPDLPALNLATLGIAELIVPELPQQKRKRFKEEYGIKDEAVEMFIRDQKFSDYFEEVISELKTSSPEAAPLAVNYLTSDLQSLMKEKMLSFKELQVTPENFAELIAMIAENKITSRAAKDVLRKMVEEGGDPSIIVDELGLAQKNDSSSIGPVIDKVIEENKMAVEDYKKGKEASLQFLLGQSIKLTRGSVNPEALKKALQEKIKQ